MSRLFCGIDNIEEYSSFLKGKNIALISNQSAVDASFRQSVDVLNKEFNLKCLFALEHGIRGNVQAGEKVEGSIDESTGLPVISLYGDKKAPAGEDLDGIDVVVFDIQDVGLRFYTFLYSLGYAMQACDRAGIPLLLLDRPNPLSGSRLDGCMLDKELHSFVGEYPIPTRYGLTMGEFALFVKKYLGLKLDLRIARLKNWDRGSYFDETGLAFIPPSPNLPNIEAVLCYSGTCIFEGTNISEGRGTALPFQMIGAPFINAEELADSMNNKGLLGLWFRPCCFTPCFSKHERSLCKGVQIHITNREEAKLFLAGLSLVEEIWKLCPNDFEFLKAKNSDTPFLDKLLGTAEFRLGKITAEELFLRESDKLQSFFENCEKLY